MKKASQNIYEDMENIAYEIVKPSDAAELIEYMNKVGGQSDNLSFGEGGFKMTVEGEKAFIEKLLSNPKAFFMTAKLNGKIIGQISIAGLPRRMSHIGELSITVLKEYWGQGIGTALMRRAVEFARQNGFERIKLDVRSDNERAVKLYKKTGFVKTGELPGYFKVDGKDYDVDVMFLEIG